MPGFTTEGAAFDLAQRTRADLSAVVAVLTHEALHADGYLRAVILTQPPLRLHGRADTLARLHRHGLFLLGPLHPHDVLQFADLAHRVDICATIRTRPRWWASAALTVHYTHGVTPILGCGVEHSPYQVQLVLA